MTADPRSIARELVETITDTVLRRFNPRTRALVPPRLTGRCPVPNAKAGEAVMDAADELLEPAFADWPQEVEREVYLDLLQERSGWVVEWVVEGMAADGDAEGDEEGAARSQ